MTIREIKPHEVSLVKNLMHQTIKACYPKIYQAQVVDFFINYHSVNCIRKRIESGIVVVGLVNNTLCATGFLDKGELGGVYIHPDYQRRGYGIELVDYILIQASKIKLSKVWLDSTPFALKLYLSRGFKVIEERTQYVKDNTPLDYYYMEKQL